MPVRDKRTELHGPLSLSPVSLTVCLMSPTPEDSRALDSSRVSALAAGPQDSSRVRCSSDGWLLGDEGCRCAAHFSGIKKKDNTCRLKSVHGNMQLGCDLVCGDALKWPCFWWAVSHGEGTKEEGGDDEIHGLSPDRLGRRPPNRSWCHVDDLPGYRVQIHHLQLSYRSPPSESPVMI